MGLEFASQFTSYMQEDCWTRKRARDNADGMGWVCTLLVLGLTRAVQHALLSQWTIAFLSESYFLSAVSASPRLNK